MENKDNNEDVKQDVETKYVEPSGDNEELVETEESSSSDDSKEEETEEEENNSESEENPPREDEPKLAEGESLREYALRKELENTRKQLRKEKQEELFQKANNPKNDDDFLAENDPDEVKKLEKIISKLGYAKKQEIQSQTYEEKANDQLSEFLDKHQEYLPENDKDGALWNEFRREFGLYKQPDNPKEYKKIFERIHSNLKGSSSIDIKRVNASREKLKVASHTGATMQGRPIQKQQVSTGLRTDMLKGFGEDEIKEIFS